MFLLSLLLLRLLFLLAAILHADILFDQTLTGANYPFLGTRVISRVVYKDFTIRVNALELNIVSSSCQLPDSAWGLEPFVTCTFISV